MMNLTWLVMILAGIVVAASTGRIDTVAQAIVNGGEQSISLSLSLLAVLTFWLGLARVAEKAGLLQALARMIAPLLRPLFPSLRGNEEAMKHIVLNFCANLLGLGNAATPFGLHAMQAMQNQNQKPDTATDAMCTFLVLNTAGMTMIPTTVIALRAANGSSNPTAVVGITFFAGIIATIVGLIVDLVCRKLSRQRGRL